MRSAVAGLALPLLLAAAAGCSEDEGTRIVDADQLRLEIVSGQDQSAEVNIGASTGTLSDPIVARVTDIGGNVIAGSASGDGGVTGITDLQMPVGTFIQFSVREPEFGAADETVGIPDDTGYVSVEWIKGAQAGEGCMDMHLRIGTDTLDSDVVCAEFQPGPPVTGLGWDTGVSTTCTNCTQFDANSVRWPSDGNGNRIRWRFAIEGGPAHTLSDGPDDDGSRILVADSQGTGGIRVITVRADTSDGILTVGTDTAGVPFMRLDGWMPR